MTPDSRPGRWVGHSAVSAGTLSFTGDLGSADMHAHAAVQLLEIDAGGLLIRDARGHERLVTSSALIPTGVKHEVLATGSAHGTITYYEPSSRNGALLATRLAETEGDPNSVDTWVTAAGRPMPPGVAPAPILHPALRHAVESAPTLIDGPARLADLAAQVGVSASRLGHLFTDELGLTYPTWRRWVRLQHALSVVAAGGSLTDAAHGAGFADSAHLTRSCRAMFGITPSQALAAVR